MKHHCEGNVTLDRDHPDPDGGKWFCSRCWKSLPFDSHKAILASAYAAMLEARKPRPDDDTSDAVAAAKEWVRQLARCREYLRTAGWRANRGGGRDDG